jgi:hypothetical protein
MPNIVKIMYKAQDYKNIGREEPVGYAIFGRCRNSFIGRVGVILPRWTDTAHCPDISDSAKVE